MNVAPVPGPGVVGAQAVALRIAGDQAAFWGCGFFGAQDTLHDDRVAITTRIAISKAPLTSFLEMLSHFMR
ncbi:UNVERIFIED_CONTAM: putative pectinesterase 8 [Sesamum latifolium]|uniref:Pectinesterase 8 n=1 Tax=Sesamum latifolium TaxID=2727402 RepID=A0AAW2UFR6_9LAMI